MASIVRAVRRQMCKGAPGGAGLRDWWRAWSQHWGAPQVRKRRQLAEQLQRKLERAQRSVRAGMPALSDRERKLLNDRRQWQGSELPDASLMPAGPGRTMSRSAQDTRPPVLDRRGPI